ncbi:MAG: RNA-guided endonuclease IscB [Cyanobacteria bacterium J06649_11]
MTLSGTFQPETLSPVIKQVYLAVTSVTGMTSLYNSVEENFTRSAEDIIMSNFVFVLNADKQPISPIHPGKARRLLKQHKAAVYRKFPFTIILKDLISQDKEHYQLKLDPGSKNTGIAIVASDKLIWAAVITHRGEQIKSALSSRSQIRRSRRSRKTRYREPRFLNRVRKKGWLPPSILSRIENIITWVKRIVRYVPITGISQELVKFDTQALQNPEITGKEYQQAISSTTTIVDDVDNEGI